MSVSDTPNNTGDGGDHRKHGGGSSKKVILRDGRTVAYIEKGVPKEQSKYRVIVVHGFDSSKDMNFVAPRDLMEELGVYVVLFDRAGYGESDPNDKRTQKSESSDIEELADRIGIGPKFYLISNSMGSYPTWGCLRRIPERLLGVAMVVPPVNYQWPSVPDILTRNDDRRNVYRVMLWIGKYAPWFGRWLAARNPSRNDGNYSERDRELIRDAPNGHHSPTAEKLRDKRVYKNLSSDFAAAFCKWDFDPLEMKDPFPEKKGSVQIWQGCQDKFINVELQRYVARRLPWIRYYEVPDGGHCLVYDGVICEAIFRALLLGDDPYRFRPF